MTPEEIKKLKPGDRIRGIPSMDPFLRGRRFYKGEVVRLTEHSVIICTDNPEDLSNGESHSFSDPRLVDSHSLGPWKPGEPPWLEDIPKKKRQGLTTGNLM